MEKNRLKNLKAIQTTKKYYIGCPADAEHPFFGLRCIKIYIEKFKNNSPNCSIQVEPLMRRDAQ